MSRTIADVMAEKTELEHRVQALYRSLERKDTYYEEARPLCPDHRDKQRGKGCLACRLERAVKQRDEMFKLLQKFAADPSNELAIMLRANTIMKEQP